MTRDEIMGLSGRKFNLKMAEFVGLKPRMVRSPKFSGAFATKQDGWIAPDGTIYLKLPDFENDHNAVRLVLAEVERRGQHVTFVGVLEDIIWPEPVGIDEVGVAWGLLNAAPRQICQSALLAVEVA